MRNLSFILLLISHLSFGAETYEAEINILDLCPPENEEKEVKAEDCLVLQEPKENTVEELQKNISDILTVKDPPPKDILLFCQSVRELSKKKYEFKPIEIKKTDPDGDKWNIKFYFGYTRTQYFNSDVKLRSSRVNVDIKDFKWNERHSFNFFHVEELKGKGNTFRFIDEPTNTFMINLEKGNDVFTFSLFHMKYTMDNDQVKHVTGTLDGVYVDKVMPVREKFDGYNNQPGEMHLWRLENTYQQVNPQIGYGRKLNIINSKKYGKLSYTPSVQVGFIAGDSFSAYAKKGEYWESEQKTMKWGAKGVSFSAGQRLEYEKGRLGVFADQKFTTTKIKHTFLDGTATYRLNMMPVTIGVAVKIYKKSKAKPVDPLVVPN